MEDICEGKEYSFPNQEEKTLRLWEELNAFETQLKRTEGKPEYIFYDGPPFATGLPHYGHILAGTIKDIVTRYQTATGHHVTRRFGWDCHGLPVEYEIDKKLGIKGKSDVLELGIGNYNEECRSIVMRYSQEWEKTVTRMGRWIDFQNDYKTMNPEFMESVWWVFKQLYEKGYVYQGLKVMPYSTGCTTVLSNFEAGLNYKDVSDPAVMVAFPLVDDADKASMVAWTTTPWTLPSNLVLCVNANLTYSKVRNKTTGAVYIVAESRLSQLPSTKTKGSSAAKVKADPAKDAPTDNGAAKKGDKKGDKKGAGHVAEQTTAPVDSSTYEVLDQCKGIALVGKKYKPLFDYFLAFSDTAFKVVADNYVSDDSGTGVVHCAPAFGEDDYRVCLANGVIQKGPNLPNPVDGDGKFTAEVPEFQGRFVKDADKEIIAALKANGRLLSVGSIMHSYPYCWRSETPLIYKVVPSWYVAVEQFKDRLIENNKHTYWVPDSVKEKRFHNWLENARDWAVSRTRFWGTPLPIWRSDDGVDTVVIGSIQELEELSGFKATDLHRHHIDHVTIPSPRGPEYGVLKRVEDVFDCWFESGSMPYAYIHYPFENQELFERNFPGHFVAEGLDQTRGWFYTLMVLSTALFDRPAFQNLICNGLVLAEDGKKMSKRLNNYPPPTDIINEYGADALRLYLINSPVVKGEPLRFKREGVYSVVKDVFLPWYNAYRFLVQNVKRLDAEGLEPFKPLDRAVLRQSPNVLDRWINSASQSLVTFVRQEMEAYRLYTVVPVLLKFIDNLTNVYVRFNRKRLKGRTGDGDSRVALSTLYFVLLTTVKAMAPFTPFFTEGMYQNLRLALPEAEESVHYCAFPEVESEMDKRIEQSVTRMMSVIDLARNIRERHNKPLKTPLKEMVVVHSDTNFLDDITGSLGEYVREELNVRNIVACNDLLKFASLRAEPDYSGLGKKLGKAMGLVAKEVKAMTQAQILEFQKAGEGTFAGHKLGFQDIKVINDFKPPDGVDKADIDAAGDGEVLVVLDLRPDGSLLEAGFAREVVNRVQKLRKKAGLEPTDTVEIFYDVHENVTGSDPSVLKRIFQSQASYMTETVGSPIVASQHLPHHAVIIASEEYHGVAGGSFKITLTRPALSFSMDLLSDLCSGDKACAENLTVVLRSRDPAKLRSEVSSNKKLKVAIDGLGEYEVEEGKHFFFSVADHVRARKV
ncbi:isoleucine--tRNA ligase, cytoplasmic isoform X2 [Physcomitrium patens]|uniref:isoleucine--tRNA ligase n=1 Tax=Physcomitrium patens TaxID=3218 RepID=A0A2K1J8Y9_PHYPA|nr:isoleucine--tRNA ligase, cytoplasmic-like isoform X2 [Physcomitrium patens]PNR37993.1 hypothetical protein PHYPA_021104 [Physcomitrium patens]|eukprot:XP_024399139.1 isoleucine--tRNA ligase, cytoplasmic-like isoform X2 [Physcomitrella patens]